jgi:hypothetical protein
LVDPAVADAGAETAAEAESAVESADQTSMLSADAVESEATEEAGEASATEPSGAALLGTAEAELAPGGGVPGAGAMEEDWTPVSGEQDRSS